ncbi:MAG TPA: rhomboid family intramembrane serine protease [Polyangia bacterium]|jgi:membrane associated rhomboid family serine protease|nr:rhomboid family intramembrane serine protease [Polyangia bacterium]
MDEPLAPTVIRQTSDPALAQDWALVLTSAEIAHDLRLLDRQFVLAVAAVDLDAAGRALDTFDAERATDYAAAPPPVPQSASALGVAAVIVLTAFYLVAGSREAAAPSRWLEVGSASARLLLQGQWWRAFTAMTLHGDLLHLAGNAIACLIFVTAVGRWLGSGLGAAAILLSGAAANLLTALVHRRVEHVSIGASTGTFAALGILAGLGALRRWRSLPQRRRAWVPIGAALGLFAMLGVGAGTDLLGNPSRAPPVDVFGHLFGLAVGAAMGVALARIAPRRLGPLAQAGFGLAAAGLLAGSWWLAFHA